ncbi:MAG: rhomboid family intramembrane serine protease [Planctomycetota bacterium]
MFLPLKDDNPLAVIRFQWVTVPLALVLAGLFAWSATLPPGEDVGLYHSFGLIPAALFEGYRSELGSGDVPPLATLLTYLFVHGGWVHLGSNLLFLWIFGDNVEDATGHVRFALFFLLCGAAGGVLQAVVDPASRVPIVGASGAISGVLGGYLMLHPRVRVLVLMFKLVPIRLPVFLLLPGWVLLQLAGMHVADGVATWAHVGGFLSGLVLIVPLRRRGIPLFDRGRTPGGLAT